MKKPFMARPDMDTAWGVSWVEIRVQVASSDSPIRGSRFKRWVLGLGFRDEGLGIRDEGLWFRDEGLGV